jgi:hypothetical protein
VAGASLDTLVKRVRRRVNDWPPVESLSASLSAGASTVTVVTDATTRYATNWRVEIDAETMWVTAVAATQLTVVRAALGSTATTHAAGATILNNPRFSWVDIVDCLNDGINNLWPFFYQDVVDETITPDGAAYEFNIPAVSSVGGEPIRRIRTVEMRLAGFTDFREMRRWTLVRGATPKIRFMTAPAAGTVVRLRGYAPLPRLAAAADTLSSQLPYNAEDLAVHFAVGQLLYSGEAGRVRFDEGPVDEREQANAPRVSMAAGREYLASFYRQAAQLAMPPFEASLEVGI